MKRTLTRSLLGAALLTAFAAPASAAQFSVTVTNLTHGIYFTPLLVSAHSDSSGVFQVGTAASANLRAMAEGGDISGLASDLAGLGATTVENPAAGLLAPAASTTANLNTDGTSNNYLSVVAMMLPTNDGFIGLDSIQIPTAPGTYSYNLNAYDAGTEANDELITGGGAPGVAGIPADPSGAAGTGGTGVASSDSNTNVHIHRGALGDSNPTGGASDLNSSVHRWLNPVARVTITVN